MKVRHTNTQKGYIARDENGFLFFFPRVKPKRYDGVWLGGDIPECYSAAPDNPEVDITWEDEPREAILTTLLDVEPK